MQPSEKIRGLADLEARAAKQEARDKARRSAGGGINMVEALAVDDIGHRWSRNVLLGIAGLIGFVVMAGALMFWISNRKTIDPEEAIRDTNNRLSRYANTYSRMMPAFDIDEYVTKEKVKKRMKAFLEKELEELRKVEEQEKKGGAVSSNTRAAIRRVSKDLEFKDAWGDPLRFSMEGNDTAVIKSIHSGVKKASFTVKREER